MPYWRSKPAATKEEIDHLRSLLPDTPEGLLQFLSSSNGGEGDLGLEPMWLQLFSIDQILEASGDEFYRSEFPNYLFFGTNGGLEMLAFDKTNKFRIVMLDTIAGTESAITIADNFSEFETAIGKEVDLDART